MKHGLLIVLLSALITTLSCKEVGDVGSEADSLDNFASGEAKGYATNKCEGTNFGASFKPVKSADYAKLTPADHANNVIVIEHHDAGTISAETLDSLKRAYAALPTETQSLLQAFRVKIRLAKDVGGLCGVAFTNDNNADIYMTDRDKAKIDACWRFLTITSNNHRSLEIVIKNNPTDVGHYLVRQVGYLYSQYFMYLEGEEAVARAARGQISPAELNNLKGLYHGVHSDQEFVDMKHKLTAAFLDDMVSPSNTNFDIKNLDYLLGNGDETKATILAAQQSGQKNLAAYFAKTTFNVPRSPNERQKAAFATGFTDYVLADGFDSAACNVAGTGKTVEGKSINTLERFRGLFPNAFAVWSNHRSQRKYAGTVGYLNVLKMHSRYLANVVNTAESGAGGLRLTTVSVQNNYQPATADVLGNAAFGDDVGTYNNGNFNVKPNPINQAAFNQYMAQMASINAQYNQALTLALGRIASGVAVAGQNLAAQAAQVSAAQAAAAATQSGCPNCNCSGPGCSCKNCQQVGAAAASAPTGCGCGGCCGKGGCSCPGCANCANVG